MRKSIGLLVSVFAMVTLFALPLHHHADEANAKPDCQLCQHTGSLKSIEPASPGVDLPSLKDLSIPIKPVTPVSLPLFFRASSPRAPPSA